ncbi:MAG: pitrilysin family protein [bacterium]
MKENQSLIYHKEVLDNGLRVIMVEMPHLHSVEISLYVKAGTRFENAGNNGISHFVEHMLFRGTKSMPSSYLLHRRFESLGGDINAVTGVEDTCFWLSIHPRYFEKGLACFSEMFLSPQFANMETEKQIVLEEILNETNEKGEDIDIDNLSSRMLWPDDSLGFSTLGTRENIMRFTEEEVRSFFQTYYTASNIVLCIAGKASHQKILACVRKYFSGLPTGREIEIISPKSSQKAAQVLFKKNPGSQANVQICFRSVSYNAPDYYATLLVQRIMDSGNSSRLQWNIREKQGLVYDISASVSSFYDTGTFDVDFSVAPEKISRVVQEIFREIQKLTLSPVSLEEFQRAKRRYMLEFDFALDNVAKMADRFGWMELFRQGESLESEREKIKRVTREEVLLWCREHFVNAGLNIVVLGQYSKEEESMVRTLAQEFPLS